MLLIISAALGLLRFDNNACLSWHAGSTTLCLLFTAALQLHRPPQPPESELARGGPAAEAVLAATYVGGATASLGRPTPSYAASEQEAAALEPDPPEDEATVVPPPAPARGDGVPTHRARGGQLQRSAPPEGLGRLSSGEARLHAAEGGRSGVLGAGQTGATAGQASAYRVEPVDPAAVDRERAASGAGVA